MSETLLSIRGLKKKYPIYGPLGKLFGAQTYQNAVCGMSLDLYKGEVYGLVGESGCGKTTVGRAVLGLLHPEEGQILYQGTDLAGANERERRRYCREIQLVFQDSLSSLNPRQRIGALLEEPLAVQKIGTAAERRQKVLEMLDRVGLSQEHYFRYPHELSGGQVQRLGIARALIIEPKLVVCDEPVSALDVSIQAQILNMLKRLQKEMGISLLFISHDIGVVRYLSQRIGVMYLGSLVEEAKTEQLFKRPLHPYTQALFSAIPDIKERKTDYPILQGERPLRTDAFRGCVFHTRCPYATERCRREEPQYREAEPGHRAACHRVMELGTL